MKQLPLISVAFALAILVSASAPAKTFPVDHFRCYPVKGPTIRAGVLQLEDQFDAALKKPEKISTLQATRLCNPVQKTIKDVTSPIVNRNHHLLMYVINEQAVVARTVVIRNQFGEQTLKVSAARFLAVPTGKSKATQPAPLPSTDLDHYKCYTAEGNPLKEVFAELKDQFTVDEKVQVFKPVSFCNPVRKTHGDVVRKIQHPEIHLACYATSESTFKGAKVNTLNQFGKMTLLATQPDMLCAPSLKVKWARAGATAPTRPIEPGLN